MSEKKKSQWALKSLSINHTFACPYFTIKKLIKCYWMPSTKQHFLIENNGMGQNDHPNIYSN
jgi:hypothetical protein